MRNKKGFSLIELIVAVMIMALTVGGLANVFVGAKKHIRRSQARMSGGELGKAFLDPLRMQVRQDQWSSNCIGANLNCPRDSVTIDARDYTPSYTIDNVDRTSLRRVRLTVRWLE